MKKHSFFFLITLLLSFLFISALSEEITPRLPIPLPEADEAENLAAAYIYQTLPHRQRPLLRAAVPSGLRLEEPSRSLYSAMRTHVSEIAAGNQSNTEIPIPYNGIVQNTFSADELEIETLAEDGEITTEAKEAAKAALLRKIKELDTNAVIHCLLSDSPYELYWFDKTKGHGASITYMVSGYSADLASSTITIKGNIVVRMYVSQDYAEVSYDADGSVLYAPYTVDTIYGTSVQAAAERAAEILNMNKGKSDGEKLAAYRDAICELAEYNDDVSESDPYGDPWQLIWVFDGKPNTKVVCEGYAKAFQYLCENEMGPAEATAISVQGQTSRAHMWNIVSIYGHNYLVDLTNYDLGNDLFMKGYSSGDVASGYTIHHNHGSIRYIYDPESIRHPEELELYSMDYADWKEKALKTPEIELSSTAVYPGYDALIRIINEDEDPAFTPAALMLHGESTTEISLTDGIGRIPAVGEYTISVIRDGAESSATDPVILTAAEFPDESLSLPVGTEIETEAFAGNNSISFVSAKNCVFHSNAFAGSPVKVAKLDGCKTEPAAFERSTVLCLDQLKEWISDNPFLIIQQE